MSHPKISVVLPVKDRSHFLTEALISLQNQTFSDWECVIVDDHSTENIKAVVAAFAEPRFRYVKNTGKPGISSSRNLGSSLAQADWIAVADSDDINLPRRLALTWQAILDNPEADVFYSTMYTVKDGTYEFKLSKKDHTYDRERLYKENFIFHGASTYRRELVLEVGYSEDLESAVDYDLWLSFADRKASFVFIEEPVAVYRRHAEQISTDPERLARQTANAQKIRENHQQFI